MYNHIPVSSSTVFTEHRSLPVCPSDASATMSPEERIAVYNYCVQQLKDRGKMPNVEKDEILTTDWEKIIKKGECCLKISYIADLRGPANSISN